MGLSLLRLPQKAPRCDVAPLQRGSLRRDSLVRVILCGFSKFGIEFAVQLLQKRIGNESGFLRCNRAFQQGKNRQIGSREILYFVAHATRPQHQPSKVRCRSKSLALSQ